MTQPASFANQASLADQPVMLLTTRYELQNLIAQGVELALERQQKKSESERRLTSKEAAKFLGCSVYHLQDLHKRGLPYEKGRPNYYKVYDLEEVRENKRLQLG